MEQVEEICEDIALINNGQNILSGKVRDIRERFKENIYSIKYEGDVPAHLEGKLNVIRQGNKEIVVKLETGHSPNELLKFCLDNDIEVHGFQEIFPTINSIFISQVSAAHQPAPVFV